MLCLRAFSTKHHAMRQFFQTLIRDRKWRVVLGGGAGVICLIILLDQVIVPLIVHSRETVVMPNVIGMPQEQAVKILEQYKLRVHDIQHQYDSVYAAGRVVLQSPYPGATVRQGRRVYLVVSRGEETVRIPSVLGMSLRDAQIALLREGLQIGRVQVTPCTPITSSGIIDQSPPAGALVRTGTPIHLTLCQDTAQIVTVPDLIRRSQQEAQELLEQAQLQLGEVILQYDGTFVPGTVLRQEPAAGSRVPPGTTVRLWVASDM